MSSESDDDWTARTVIQKEDLLKHIFEVDKSKDGKVEISRYCILPAVDSIDYDSFIDFICSNFKYYVLSQEEVEEYEEAHLEAQRKSAYKLKAENEGLYGELILFTLVEGLLDMPIASHKVAWTQNPNDEVKGSDGLFYGEYNGEESLAIGESKIKGQRSEAVKDSLNSIDRFYTPEGKQKREHELTVAARNLPQGMSQEQVSKLSSIMTGSSGTKRTIHPIFVCYNSAKLQRVQERNITRDELKEELKQEISDYDISSYIQEKLEEDYPEIKRHWLIMMLLPVDDTSDLQESMKQEIYPYANQ